LSDARQAQLRFGLGAYEEALALAEPLQRFQYQVALGRFHEALADAKEESARLHAAAADTLLRRDDPKRAVAHLDRAIELMPRSPSLKMARADALVELGDDRALMAIAGAVRGSGDHPDYRSAAARMCLRIGAFEEAEAWGDDEVRGHLSLFRGDSESALRVDHPLIRGAALSLRGDDGAAEVELRAAGGWEARVWLGDIALKRGDFAAAIDHAQSAAEAAPGLLISAQILRLLATLKSGLEIGDRDGYGEIAGAVLALTGGAPDEATLQGALALMRGNRTVTPSYVRDGKLQLLRFPAGPRHASRRIMIRVATSPEDELLAELDRVIANFPETGLARCYRAELALWFGRYGEARADLDEVIRRFPDTRWAYIGRATVDMLEEKFSDALEILAVGIARKGGTMGPPAYAVRGEIFRRVGRREEALRDLETACKLTPRRLSAWINLALLKEEVVPFVRAHAAPLLADASELADALSLMQGNRSSSGTTWRVPGKPLRFFFFDPSAEGLLQMRKRELAFAQGQAPRSR
jgi:tetratricopeptide (TPR) repeat protein